MFNKLKEIKQMMSLLKDIKESGEVFENTEEMFTKLGVDKDFIENELGKYFININITNKIQNILDLS